MNAPLVSNDLWDAIEPFLPKEPPKPKGGRPRVPDRAALGGVLVVLRTGCPWRMLPMDLSCGSGWICWRRLRNWQVAGVWARLHERLSNWLGDDDAIDWSRTSADGLSVRAKEGEQAGPISIDRGKPGSKYHLVVDRNGTPASSGSRPPTLTMRRNCSHSSMRSHRSSARAGGPGVLVSARPSCTPTKPTTRRNFAAPSALAASHPASPATGSTRASNWAGTAGWSSARFPGCSVFAASGCATHAALTCSKASCTRPALTCLRFLSAWRRNPAP
jgi:transposase